MQNVTSPRQNIHSLISSIRAIAQDVSREVGSNPQDPSFSIQPTQSQPNSFNMQSSIVQSHKKPVLTNSQTISSNTNANISKQSGDMGTLLQGIQKAHAKVDEVIRSVPREVHDQVLSGQVRSLTNVPGVSSFQNLQNAPSSLQDISSSYRLTAVPSSSQPAYLQQSNLFVKNSAFGEIPITTSTPYLMPPAASYGPRKSENVPGQPVNAYQSTNYNLYQSVSLNEIPNPPEATEENRPKSLLYASNYFKSASKQDVQHQTPLQQKYKQFFPRQYPPTSSQQKVQGNSMTQSQLEQSENIRKSQAVEKQEAHQSHPVEKILEKLRSQEERHKRQRFEEDAYVYDDADTYAENPTFSQAGYGKAESVRRTSKRRGSRDSRKHLELQEDTGSLILPNNVSEQSVGINSRQDIERRIEQIGKESRKPAPKKVIPSLGGGQLVIEKKESYDLDRNTQVFGKETSSGGNMLRLGSRKRTDSSARDRNPEEFMVKRISSGHRRQRETDDEEFDFEGEDGEYEQYYYGEEPKRMRQPRQEEQDFQDGYQRSGKGNRSRSRIQNGDMVWSSQKKSKEVLKSIKF